MFARHCLSQTLLLLLALPNFIVGGPVSNPEITAKTGKSNNNLSLQQQQQQQQQQHQQQQQRQQKSNNQDSLLNSLNVYATNYDVISNNQNSANDDQFKPSYKLPEMETNFTPIQNGNSIAPDYAANAFGSPAPLLMQYLPQTVNEGGVQYLQLIPTRPLMVPIGPYLTANNELQSLPYQQQQQHLTAPQNIDYSGRPLLSALPVNMPPPAPAALMDVPASAFPAYGLQSYNAQISPYKQNYRSNRETKDKQPLGPINLNMNEYLPGPNHHHQHAAYNIRGRP